MRDERTRYVVAGLWNSIFGWVSFSLLWLALREMAPLLAINVIAHVLATSQAFFVQRRFVFAPSSRPVWRQFVRFQLSYLLLLAIGSALLEWLVRAGLHPIAASFAGICILACCGFVLGKFYTFAKPAPLSKE